MDYLNSGGVLTRFFQLLPHMTAMIPEAPRLAIEYTQAMQKKESLEPVKAKMHQYLQTHIEIYKEGVRAISKAHPNKTHLDYIINKKHGSIRTSNLVHKFDVMRKIYQELTADMSIAYLDPVTITTFFTEMPHMHKLEHEYTKAVEEVDLENVKQQIHRCILNNNEILETDVHNLHLSLENSAVSNYTIKHKHGNLANITNPMQRYITLRAIHQDLAVQIRQQEVNSIIAQEQHDKAVEAAALSRRTMREHEICMWKIEAGLIGEEIQEEPEFESWADYDRGVDPCTIYNQEAEDDDILWASHDEPALIRTGSPTYNPYNEPDHEIWDFTQSHMA